MHHAKRARIRSAASDTYVPPSNRFETLDTKSELRTRLRFQNKKPLCLQYNRNANERTKKVLARMKRRNGDDHLLKSVVPYMISLFYLLLYLQYRVVQFLLCPIEEIIAADAPSPGDLSRSSSASSTCSMRSYSSNSSAHSGSFRARSTSSSSRRGSPRQQRDYGRNARLQAHRDRMCEIFLPP